MILKLSDRIRELREKNEMTQSDLARYMNITRAGVNAWEMGISVPATEKIVELAKLFHTSADYLLGIASSETVNLENYEIKEKEIIYHLLNYFDSTHDKSDKENTAFFAEKSSQS